MDSTRGVKTMGDRNNEEVLREMQLDFLKYDLQYCIVELYTSEDLPPLYTYISQGVLEDYRPQRFYQVSHESL